MNQAVLCSTAMNHNAADRAYIDAHRFLYGDLGEHIATAAILFRDQLMRPGFVLPVIRPAPVAPYGKCAGLSGNSSAISHVPEIGHGIWLYLHERFFGAGPALLEAADEGRVARLVGILRRSSWLASLV